MENGLSSLFILEINSVDILEVYYLVFQTIMSHIKINVWKKKLKDQTGNVLIYIHNYKIFGNYKCCYYIKKMVKIPEVTGSRLVVL